MATVTGAGYMLSLVYDDAPGARVSSNLERFTTPAAFATTVGAQFMALTSVGTLGAGGKVVSITKATGDVKPDSSNLVTSGQARFEQIHVTLASAAWGLPNRRALGNLLSSVPISIEVWSAYRLLTLTLNSIALAGPAGVTLPDPFGTPLTFSPLRSRFYTATIGINGGPNINNSIDFDFNGISEPLALFTGSRLVPFPFEPDWGEELKESYEWRTAILAADNGNEQRVRLRTYPRKFLAYTVKTFSVREASYLESLLYGWLDQKYGVPAWHEAMRLTATATAGAMALTVSSSNDRDLHAGQTVLLWQDPFTWEAKTVSSVVGTTINLVDTLSSTWADKTTLVLPVWIGALNSDAVVDRPARDAGVAQIEFQLEARTV